MLSGSTKVGILAFVILALIWCVGSSAASALQYKRLPIDEPSVLILARGPIISGDFQRLGDFIGDMPRTDRIAGLALDSPGGNIVEASQLAALIRKIGWSVLIGEGGECSSACFLLFAAAPHRFVAPDALIGVHSASDRGEETVGSMAFTTAMAREAASYDVPPAIIGKLVETPPERAAWLTPADLASMGVVTIDTAKPSGTSSPTPAPAPQYYGALPSPDATPATPPLPSRTFEEGLANRRAWEAWFAGLTGPFKDGAEYWSAQRSIPKPGSCYGPTGQNLGDWTAGCLAAKRVLAPSDVRRKSEPEYRAGWNSL
jgi:hypothetical protein